VLVFIQKYAARRLHEVLSEKPGLVLDINRDRSSGTRQGLLPEAGGLHVHPGRRGRTGGGLRHRRCLRLLHDREGSADEHVRAGTGAAGLRE